ncbi:SGNH/GDSL hydrolase family protein [Arthrobacter sp. zg-ZUI10]|nr:SGNH/GDSL hydrolase family protein [Arthrobacter sunyaminii]
MKRAAAGAMPPLPWLPLGLLLAGTLLAGCSTGPAIDGGTPSAASSAAEAAAAPDAAAPDAAAADTGERLAALLGNTGGPADVVLLGDSFAAGEGAGSYQPVEGVADSLCHRSAAGLLSAAGNSTVIHNAACSRARISALGSAQQMQDHGNAGVPAQLDQLRGVRPDLVLLYIGGNDAGFAELLQACIVEDTSCAGDAVLRQATKQALRDLRAPLTQLYTELGASGAPVLVLPYPRLFDAAQNPGQDACGRLTPEELSFGLDITDALNSTIEQSVAAAGLPNVRYVDALEDSFAGRGACSADPLVVTARLGPLLNAAASVSAAQEVLHPTEEGYRVLTGDLLQWMEDHPS